MGSYQLAALSLSATYSPLFTLAGRRVGTVRQSESGADSLPVMGDDRPSPRGIGPVAGRRAPSETGGPLPGTTQLFIVNR